MNAIPWPHSVTDALVAHSRAIVTQTVVLVPTDVLMPDGGVLYVQVEGGRTGATIVVSDNGAAARSVSEQGHNLTSQAAAAIWRVARQWGLEPRPIDEKGLVPRTPVLRSRPVPLSDLRWAVMVVANAARDAADSALKASKKDAKESFCISVARSMERVFGSERLTRNSRIMGSSARGHLFDWVARTEGGRKVSLDLALPEPGSVSSTVLRNLDVHRAGHPGLLQIITYDEGAPWPSEMLDQLGLAEVAVVQAGSLELALPGLVG